MDRCCICMRSVEEDHVILIKFGKKGPRACAEHIREAVAQSDCIQPTEEEWQRFASRIVFELEDLAIDTLPEQS